MNRIKVLPQLLVDKIAAGEVIERPASVVKELIENAIDAGAGNIELLVDDGGKRLIQITDDGAGIVPDDLPLVFKQHSTSKINTEDDLFAVRTFGFRGEALASIGAIGQVRLVSRAQGQPEAYEILISNGRATSPKPTAGVIGTVITVENLFHNTPARRRFLKSSSVELGHITDVVTRYALSYPEIRFVLTHQKKRLIDLPATDDILKRISHFFGKETVDELERVEHQAEGLNITAYISRPTYTRPNSKCQFYYVNKRYIRDRIISRAIGQSYFSLIPSGQYPFVVLFVDIEPDRVDVNVHPTKIEVRFQNSWQLHDEIIKVIRGHLVGSHQPKADPPLAGIDTLKLNGTMPQELAQSGAMRALLDFFGGNRPNQDVIEPGLSPHPFPLPQGERVGRGWQESSSRFIQLHNSYIILEVPDGVAIIDQHALHERLLYTAMLEQLSSGQVLKQCLLIPQSVELTHKQHLLMQEATPYLKDIGLEVEEFGKNTIRITAVPSILARTDMAEFIKSLLDDLADDNISKVDKKKALDRIVKMMACKAAVKAGDPMPPAEIKALLDLAKKSGYQATCPHGRPAIYRLSKAQVGKFFKR